MPLSKKHFKKLALILSERKQYISLPVYITLCDEIAKMCKEDNSMFDEDKFLSACEISREDMI